MPVKRVAWRSKPCRLIQGDSDGHEHNRGVRAAFAKDETLAAAFARGFIDAYAATALGVLPKTEIDLLVFSLLVEAKLIDPKLLRRSRR